MKPRSEGLPSQPAERPASVSENRAYPGRGSAAVVTVFLVVAALKLGREVFLPLALATLCSFLLSPLVTRFRRWHLGRIPSVLIAVLIAFAVLGAMGTFMASQMGDLARKLPGYQENFQKKWQSVAQKGGGFFGRITGSAENLRKQLTPTNTNTQQQTGGQNKNEKPTPVEVKNPALSPLTVVRTVIGSILSALLMLFIVIVFVIFMLFERENLRKRLISLINGSTESTTELLDEASDRVSRYLLMQLVVNVTYAIPITVCLYFVGIPNPILWGVLSGLLRYIPYIGPWIAMALPATMALAVDPGWDKPLLVFGLYGAVELIVANFVEPWLYGSSTGITPLAVLFAALFWTWIWGPLGLLLSTPLTVCLVSFGRYLPSLGFLRILFGDEPGDAKKNQPKGNSSSRSAAR
ncbi:MAG TPA: AI-2E family transporter [Verrucomicrobiae bacterium]|jgi:predicted PurR-regulated permease PerM|nr:AI-2E family transporter [Verrucomicrobiae bacterium]